MNRMSMYRRINIAALLVAAAGILVIFASNPDNFPPLPPGPIILTIAAATVAFLPWRRAPIVGLLVPLMIFIGGFASGEVVDAFANSENVGATVGFVIQLLATITAIASGAVVVTRESGRRNNARNQA